MYVCADIWHSCCIRLLVLQRSSLLAALFTRSCGSSSPDLNSRITRSDILLYVYVCSLIILTVISGDYAGLEWAAMRSVSGHLLYVEREREAMNGSRLNM